MELGLYGEAVQAQVGAWAEEAEAVEVKAPVGWGVPTPEPALVENASARAAGQKRLIR